MQEAKNAILQSSLQTPLLGGQTPDLYATVNADQMATPNTLLGKRGPTGQIDSMGFQVPLPPSKRIKQTPLRDEMHLNEDAFLDSNWEKSSIVSGALFES